MCPAEAVMAITEIKVMKVAVAGQSGIKQAEHIITAQGKTIPI
jgi:hypothetical protein